MTQKELKNSIAFWQRKRQLIQDELDQVDAIIKDIQKLCSHKYDNGTSAIDDDAFASQYAVPVCQICGKRFEKDNS